MEGYEENPGRSAGREEGGEEMWGMVGGMLGMACVVGCWRDEIRAQHFGNGEQVTYKGRLAV
jgi:hypothetical protein